MVQTIHIARHGFRANWSTATWTSPTGIARDPPLASHGEGKRSSALSILHHVTLQAQALELASYLELLPEDKRPTAIFSSPYYRCLQTSKPVAERLSLPIYIEHGLSEWYSPVTPGTGLHPRPKTPAELQVALPEINPSWNTVEIDLSWSTVWIPPRKGENVEGIHARMADVLRYLIRQVETRPDMRRHEHVLLVSHAAPIIAMCRHLVARPELPLRVGCCTLSQFSRRSSVTTEQETDGWGAVALASSVHLSDQTSLRDWGFEDIMIDGATGKVIHDVGEPGTEGEEDVTFGPQMYYSRL